MAGGGEETQGQVQPGEEQVQEAIRREGGQVEGGRELKGSCHG